VLAKAGSNLTAVPRVLHLLTAPCTAPAEPIQSFPHPIYFFFIILIIIIITGTTALCEPWPSSGFLNNLIFTV
jgi:hypothetical protein